MKDFATYNTFFGFPGVLTLRSALASLEALDPYLVPAVMMSAHSPHTSMLISIWDQEVNQIRSNVFLIVDPVAFAEVTIAFI